MGRKSCIIWWLWSFLDVEYLESNDSTVTKIIIIVIWGSVRI